MKRFKNILVVNSEADASGQILDRAVTLAQRNDARLTVMEAVQGEQGNILTSVFRASSEELHMRYALERQNQLAEEIAPRIGSGLHPDVHVQVGTPFVEIIRVVLRHQHDLVMMAAESLSGLRQRLFSSTAMHLMRKCPCPVWIMKPIPQPTFQGILAAVDPAPDDKERQALNVKILDLATSLARQEQTLLHVVHVWAPRREYFFGTSQLTTEEIDQLKRELQLQRRMALTELLEPYQLQGRDSRIHFLVGDPATAMSTLAAQHRIELTVMGTVCRTGLPGLLIGNTAEDMLAQVDCSVLAVKPDGFVSPVQTEDR
jgi:nucleotide-binding universal stress UspA family protein